jgi:hypothetical protein
MRAIHCSPLPPIVSCVVLLALGGGCVGGPEPEDTGSTADTQGSGTADGASSTGAPGACEPADPLVLASIVVELGDFPVEGMGPDGYRFDEAPCTVTAVDLSIATRVHTELDCESSTGTTHAVVLEHRSSELGDPVWVAGDSLLLSVQLRVYSDLNDIPLWDVSLRSPEGEPRALVMDTDMIDLGGSITVPFELALDADACPSDDDPEETRGILSLTLDGVTTMVLDGHDGTFETPAGTWAVELPRALTGFYGERSLYFDLVVMKVQ